MPIFVAGCDTSLPTAPGVDPAISGSIARVRPSRRRRRAAGTSRPPGATPVAGTVALPFRTIQKGVNSAGGSDTVVVQAGTYSITSGVLIRSKNGTVTAPFVLRGVGTPIIKDATGKSLYWSGLVNVMSSSNVVVTGLALRNSGFFGVMIDRSRDVTVRGNSSATSGGSALFALSSVHVNVHTNDFSNFCYLGANGRGIPCQEGVSIVSVDTFDVSGNSVHDARQNGAQVQPGGGEGIDAKEASKHGYIRFNRVWNLVQLGIYVDAWDKTAEDIEIYGNRVWNTASGIVIASEMGGTVRNVRVHDNLVYRNGFDGIAVSSYGGNGLRDRIAIYNNTVAFNGYTVNKPPYCTLWGCSDYGTGLRIETAEHPQLARARQHLVQQRDDGHGERGVGHGESSSTTNVLFPVGKSGWAPEKLGLRPIKLDPRFVLPGSNDFHLQSVSPAIKRAIGGDPLNVDADRSSASCCRRISARCCIVRPRRRATPRTAAGGDRRACT